MLLAVALSLNSGLVAVLIVLSLQLPGLLWHGSVGVTDGDFAQA